MKKNNNTASADVNEILLGYYLLGGNEDSWEKFHHSENVKEHLENRFDLIGEKKYNIRKFHAKAMAQEIFKWTIENDYKNQIEKIYWTARPHQLSKAVGFDVNSKKNPTDILIKFSNEEFLGISAKSTKGKHDIGFKNPGLGTIEKLLEVDLKSFLLEDEKLMIETFKLSSIQKKRKVFIRENPLLRKMTMAIGSHVLHKISIKLLETLEKLPQERIKSFLLNNILDYDLTIKPDFIKVTGYGEEDPFSAKVEDPKNDSKIRSIQNDVITFLHSGISVVNILGNGKKLFNIRSKFSSENMASNIKFSVQ